MILFKFYKDNCAPCYAMQRRLDQIGLPEGVTLIPLNIAEEANKKLAKEKGFDKVPVLMFSDGRSLQGMKTADELRAFLNSQPGEENAISN